MHNYWLDKIKEDSEPNYKIETAKGKLVTLANAVIFSDKDLFGIVDAFNKHKAEKGSAHNLKFLEGAEVVYTNGSIYYYGAPNGGVTWNAKSPDIQNK